MWLASTTGLFTYFCIFFFFKLNNLETDETKKKRGKSKGEILKQLKDSIMTEEIVNEDIEKTSNSIKSQDEAVKAVNNMEKIQRKKSNILLLAQVKYLKNSK